MINEALNEKLGEILLTPERQYVNMPGVDSDDVCYYFIGIQDELPCTVLCCF